MVKEIKISTTDELKILKSGRKPLISSIIHKNKKAYSRRLKHKKLND